MNKPISDLDLLLRTMEPVLNEGVFAFVSVADKCALGKIEPIATIREPEGLSAVIRESEAV